MRCNAAKKSIKSQRQPESYTKSALPQTYAKSLFTALNTKRFDF